MYKTCLKQRCVVYLHLAVKRGDQIDIQQKTLP